MLNINLVRFFDHLAVVFPPCKMLEIHVGFFQAKSEAEAEKRRLAERKERLLLKADDHGEAGADPWSATNWKMEKNRIYWYFLVFFGWVFVI